MVSLVPVLIFAAVVAAFILLMSYLGRRKRRRRWAAFARQHGLEVRPPSGSRRMQLVGEFRGRSVVVKPAATSSDTGDMGVEEVEFRLQLQGEFPEGFRVFEAEGLEAVEGQWRFEPGEADPHWLQEYFTDQRDEALDRLMELGDPGRSQLREGQLRIVDREFIPSEETLRERLESLLELAPTLDTSGLKSE